MMGLSTETSSRSDMGSNPNGKPYVKTRLHMIRDGRAFWLHASHDLLGYDEGMVMNISSGTSSDIFCQY